MASKYVLGFMLGLALISLTSGAYAGSDLDDAIKAGAKRLMADEIAERLTGKTVTFVSAKTGDKFLVFYGEANDAASKKVGGEGTKVGFYAVTDRDQVCLGWEGRDLPKLRCWWQALNTLDSVRNSVVPNYEDLMLQRMAETQCYISLQRKVD